MKIFFCITIASLLSFAAFADDLQTEKFLSQKYVADMTIEPNAQVIYGGVVVRPIFTSANTLKPSMSSSVEVLYEGFDREGKVFDSAFQRDETATFPVSAVIKCWQTAVTSMTVGSVYKITCPSDTAYGDKGAATVIKPGAAISFRVILLNIK